LSHDTETTAIITTIIQIMEFLQLYDQMTG